MDKRKLSRRQLLKAAGMVGAAAVVLDPTRVFADDSEESGRVTWDIVNVNFNASGSPTRITRGGHASAMSTDQNHVPRGRITVTGHGTFPNKDMCSPAVTGGGTWTVTAGSADCFPGSGTYRVTELLSWHRAGGTLPLPDATGDEGTPSSGLAILRALFTDAATGQSHRGTLTVSCHLPAGPTPPCTFEGITASMEYEDFWQNEQPVAVEGNRTLFHVSSNGEAN